MYNTYSYEKSFVNVQKFPNSQTDVFTADFM